MQKATYCKFSFIERSGKGKTIGQFWADLGTGEGFEWVQRAKEVFNDGTVVFSVMDTWLQALTRTHRTLHEKQILLHVNKN